MLTLAPRLAAATRQSPRTDSPQDIVVQSWTETTPRRKSEALFYCKVTTGYRVEAHTSVRRLFWWKKTSESVESYSDLDKARAAYHSACREAIGNSVIS